MVRGLIIQKKKKSCIVLTPDGEFKEAPLTENVRVGQEIMLKKTFPYIKCLFAVASVLLLALTGQLFLSRMMPADAYVSLDINPSVELLVDAGKIVIGTRAMNDDGKKLLSEVEVKRHRLPEAIELVVKQAITDGYLKSEDSSNVILATLTVSRDEQPEIDFQVIYEAIEKPLAINNMEAEVVIEQVLPELRDEASKAGLSSGRYILYQNSKVKDKGRSFTIDELQKVNLRKLKEENNIKIGELLRDDSSGFAGRVSISQKKEGFVERLQPAAKPLVKGTSSEEEVKAGQRPGNGTLPMKLKMEERPETPANSGPGIGKEREPDQPEPERKTNPVEKVKRLIKDNLEGKKHEKP